MSSNSAQMTIEAKIVDRIKKYGLHELVDDEDAIEALARKAVHEALMQPRESGDSWRRQQKDSPVVAAAREIAAKAADALIAEQVEKLKADPEFAKMVLAAMAGMIHDVLRGQMAGFVQHSAMQSVSALQEAIRSGGILGRNGQPL
jgi:predicted RNA-binding Zn ribbon-like protein